MELEVYEVKAKNSSLSLTDIELIPSSGSSTSYSIDVEHSIPDQSWYWTPEWQSMEAEADDDIAQGKYAVYDSPEAFLDSL